MAPKVRPEDSKRPNRVRFVMLEADLSDGNFNAMTQAITQALRPRGEVDRPQASLPPRVPQSVITNDADTEEQEPLEEDLQPSELSSEPTSKTARAQPKRYPIPTYLHDLAMKGQGESFKDYATRISPKSALQRYLVSAKWLKDHAGRASIDVNEVFTCYKTAGWPATIGDWDGAFRTLKKADKVRRADGGGYAITPLGENDVEP